MIDRLLRWLGWRRPQEKPEPGRNSSTMLRLQRASARTAVDDDRRPERGGTGTGPDNSKKAPPPTETTDGETPLTDPRG